MRKIIASAVWAATLCWCVSAAHALSVTLGNGAQYEITTTNGAFDDLQGTLEAQAHWGDLTLAADLRDAVADNVGTPNMDPFFGDPAGPIFAFESNASSVFGPI